MDEKCTSSIDEFLKGLPGLHEAALLLADSGENLRVMELFLISAGFKRCDSWAQIAAALQNGTSVVFSLASQISEETISVMSQFQRRGGNLQVMDRPSLELLSYSYNPGSVSIIISSLREDWSKHPQQVQILEHVGPVVSVENLLCQD